MSVTETFIPSPQSLTIALVCDCFYPNVGGVESHIYQLAQCLLLRGHRVIVISHAYGRKFERQGVRYMARGLKVYYIPYRPFFQQVIFITVFGLFPVIRDIFIREDVQVVHGHSAFSPLALECLLHAKALGLSAIFTDHSLFGFADLSSILSNKALAMFLNTVDNFVCVSHVAKENTVLRGKMRPDQVFVIPNAIDSSSFTPDPSARDPDHITIIVVSRLVYRKGTDLLTAIIPPVCATFANVRFIIAGDGEKRLALEEMCERHNLHSQVQLLGALPHHKVRDVLVKGDIFLNTSLTESFCIAIVEAASCGLLVVSTAVGGIPEVLPPHMLRLAPVSASGLAGTLADVVEEVHQQRLQWISTLALHKPQSSFLNSTSCLSDISMAEENIAMETHPLSFSGLGCITMQSSVPVIWPPTTACQVFWRRHFDVRKFYTWPDVAKRTEKVYLVAMKQPKSNAKECMLAAFRKLGIVSGKIMAIIWVIEWLLLLYLEWTRPAEFIDRVPFFYTTPVSKSKSSTTENLSYEDYVLHNPDQ